MTAPRLFIDAAFAPDARIALDAAQSHYVRNVMRLDAGGALRVFNDVQGEWDAEIVEADKKGVAIATRRRRRSPGARADLLLVFAPLKKTRTDFVVEKATELGVSALQPVFTRRTNAERVNLERLQSLAREAAEQSERLDVPEVREPVPLATLLDAWPAAEPGRRLAFCDEAEGGRDTPWADGAAPPSAGTPALKAFFAAPETKPSPWGVLIGPEGGFDPDERKILRGCAFVTPIALGPRILRADTAAVAALTLWQSVLGDWR